MNCYRCFTFLLCFLGLTTCLLVYYVEMKKAESDEYEAICDLNEDFKCSDVLLSKYAVGFGLVAPTLGQDHILNVPNPIYGLAFYLLVFALAINERIKILARVQFYFVLLTNFISVYLGYIMVFVIKKYCIFCIITYVINFLLTIVSYLKKRTILSKEYHHPYSSNTRIAKNEPSLPFDFKKNI